MTGGFLATSIDPIIPGGHQVLVNRELDPVWSFLNEINASYCVLQSANVASLISEGDIDLYLDPVTLPELQDFLISRGWFQGYDYLFPEIRREFSKVLVGFRLKLDICLAPVLFGQDGVLRFRGDLKTVKGRGGCLFLADDTGALFTLCKARLKREIDSPKAQRAMELLRQLPSFDEECLNGELSRNFEWVEMQRYSRWRLARASFKKFLPRSKPLLVACVGVDGAGKSTLLAAAQREFKQRNLTSEYVYLGHSKFTFEMLRTIADAKSAGCRIQRLVVNLLYLSLFPFELMKRRGVARPDIIFFDRHPLFELVRDDLLGSCYANLLTVLVGCPDIIFFLNGEPKTIWERKKEVSFEEFSKQIASLEARVKALGKRFEVKVIDTTTEQAECLAAIFHAVVPRLEGRPPCP
jgi:thymidylate kinase